MNVGHIAAAATNLLACSFIVIINKFLFTPSGHNFTYPTTLSAVHYLLTYIWAAATSKSGNGAEKPKPIKPFVWKYILWNIVTGVVSIFGLNASLMYNSAGFQQIAKLMVIPVSAIMEYFALNKRLSYRAMAAISVMAAGILIATASAIETTNMGLFLAAISVFSTAASQVLVRYTQTELGLSVAELLRYAKPGQGVALLLIGPSLDQMLCGKWVFTDYKYTAPAVRFLFMSCLLAVTVNVSAHYCLNKMSAVAFQVMGYLKTVAVLFLGYTLLHETVTGQELLGMVLTISGMYWFYMESQRLAEKEESKQQQQRDGAADKLMGVVEQRPVKE